MKMFKKAAALVMAAVLAVGVLAGCSSSVVTVAPEEEAILNQINQMRAAQNGGLEPLTNDATLSAAAAKLLDEFAKTPAKTSGGNGYSMSGYQVSSILSAAGITKPAYACNTREYNANNGYYGPAFFYSNTIYIAPVVSTNAANMNGGYSGYPESASGTTLYLTRRATVSSVGSLTESNLNGVYGYTLALRNNVKMGIALREIDGETYMMVLYDVTL